LPFEPAPGTVNHLITGRVRPDLKRTVAFGLLALVVAAAVRIYADLSWSSLGEGALTTAGCLLFVALAVLAVRSGASEVAAVSRTRFGDAHAAVVALLLTLAIPPSAYGWLTSGGAKRGPGRHCQERQKRPRVPSSSRVG